MRITIDIHHHFPADGDSLARLLEALMSKLSDQIDAVGTALDAAIGRVQADVAALTTEVANLQALVDSGGATQADMDKLAALRARLDALDPVSPTTLP